ncbi:MAG: MGMT family protein [Trueperaceae bacterium]|nr:MGMT family protein [Trueperaceae bacterium]
MRRNRSDHDSDDNTNDDTNDDTLGFRDRVLAAVRAIPRGSVATYGQIADLIGNPGAARQVGMVLRGITDDDTDVPWQRVINAKGGISTYKVGAGELQRALLEAEGVTFGGGERGEARCDLSRSR